jgi:hypothetical protein
VVDGVRDVAAAERGLRATAPAAMAVIVGRMGERARKLGMACKLARRQLSTEELSQIAARCKKSTRRVSVENGRLT